MATNLELRIHLTKGQHAQLQKQVEKTKMTVEEWVAVKSAMLLARDAVNADRERILDPLSEKKDTSKSSVELL